MTPTTAAAPAISVPISSMPSAFLMRDAAGIEADALADEGERPSLGLGARTLPSQNQQSRPARAAAAHRQQGAHAEAAQVRLLQHLDLDAEALQPAGPAHELLRPQQIGGLVHQPARRRHPRRDGARPIQRPAELAARLGEDDKAPQAARILGPLAGAELDEALAGEPDAEDEMGRQIARQIEGDGALRLAEAGQQHSRCARRSPAPSAAPDPAAAPSPTRIRRRAPAASGGATKSRCWSRCPVKRPPAHGAGEHAAELAVEPGGEGRELPARIGAEDEDRRLGRQALDDIDLHAKLPLATLAVRL